MAKRNFKSVDTYITNRLDNIRRCISGDWLQSALITANFMYPMSKGHFATIPRDEVVAHIDEQLAVHRLMLMVTGDI
jgi:hypothetical protein